MWINSLQDIPEKYNGFKLVRFRGLLSSEGLELFVHIQVLTVGRDVDAFSFAPGLTNLVCSFTALIVLLSGLRGPAAIE